MQHFALPENILLAVPEDHTSEKRISQDGASYFSFSSSSCRVLGMKSFCFSNTSRFSSLAVAVRSVRLFAPAMMASAF